MRFTRLFRAARNLTTVLFLALALVAPALATPPVFNGNTITQGIPTFNAAAYGLKCDNSTDDSTAINSAISAAAGLPNGGTVEIPMMNQGVCLIGSPIVMASNVTLHGVSRSIVIKRKTGSNMEGMILSGPLASISPFSGSFRPVVRVLSLPAFVGTNATLPQVYDWTVASNWYNQGQHLSNLTIDGNGSDTTANAPYGVEFGGAANFTIDHLTIQNFKVGGHTLSISNSAFFYVDDILSLNCNQGPTVWRASYSFTMAHIRTIGYQDSGAAVIGDNTYNTAPYKGVWSDVSTDGSATTYGQVGGWVGFDEAGGIDQTLNNFDILSPTQQGVTIHNNTGVPSGYIYGTNIKVYGSGGPGVNITVPQVDLANVETQNDAASGIAIQGSTVNNGSGGYQDALVSDVTITNPQSSHNAAGNYGALVTSVVQNSVNTTVNRVTLVGGNLGDTGSQQVRGLQVSQTAGAGTVNYVSVIGTTLRPGSDPTGANWGSISNYVYFPSARDAQAGDAAVIPAINTGAFSSTGSLTGTTINSTNSTFQANGSNVLFQDAYTHLYAPTSGIFDFKVGGTSVSSIQGSGAYNVGSSSYGATSASVNGAVNSLTSTFQANGTNVLFQDAYTHLYAPSGGIFDFRINGSSVSSIQGSGAYQVGSSQYGAQAKVLCSGCSNAGYLSPSLTAAGAATGVTQHSVFGVCAAGATCTVSFTPSWASATSYSCSGLAEASQASAPYISAKSAASITFTLGSSAAFDYICTGT